MTRAAVALWLALLASPGFPVRGAMAQPSDADSSAILGAPDSNAVPVEPAFLLPDSVPKGTLYVETNPSGLEIRIDDRPVGRSPIGPITVPAKLLLVRAITPDPRRFDPSRDATEIRITPGSTVTIVLDVRPSVTIRSRPEPVTVRLTRRGAAADSLLGETPLPVPPVFVEHAALRFSREAYADTVVMGSVILAGSNPFRVELRPTAPPKAPGPAPRAPLYRKRWFQWALVGAGAALTGAAVAFHNEGDRYYERYLASSDVDEIPDLYDHAVHYDHLATASLVVGQTFLIGGLVLLLFGQSQ